MANPRPFVAPTLLPPPVRSAAPQKVAEDRYAGLNPETRALVEEHERNMADFETLLRKKGLSLSKLERFAEKYVSSLPARERDEIRRRIDEKLEVTAVPPAASMERRVSVTSRPVGSAKGVPATPMGRMLRV